MSPEQWFSELSRYDDFLINLLSSSIIIFVLWLLRLASIQIIKSRTEDIRIRYHWQKTTGYIVLIVGVLIIGPLWFSGIQSLATFLGLLSAGLAIALQVPLGNFAGWIFIILRRPLRVGDRVQLGDHAGDVIDIRMFEFTLLEIGNWVGSDQSTGRVLHIPNAKVFTEVLANYSRGFEYLWNEIPVLLTFESDWEKAKSILQEIADIHTAHHREDAEERVRKAASRFMIVYSKLTPIVYTSVLDSGVLLTIRYLCEPRQRRISEEAIWENILRSFAKHNDIDFAYPTLRYYHHWMEKEQPGSNPQ